MKLSVNKLTPDFSGFFGCLIKKHDEKYFGVSKLTLHLLENNQFNAQTKFYGR